MTQGCNVPFQEKCKCLMCQSELIDKHKNQIEALTDTYKDLTITYAKLQEHHNRQIDENRLMSRRVDELELTIQQQKYVLETNLRDSFDNLRVDIQKVEKLFYDEMEKVRCKDKKPHRCPVCEGTGNHFIPPFKDCQSCNGHGVLWN